MNCLSLMLCVSLVRLTHQAEMVAADPWDACAPPETDVQNKIVLLGRGNCLFEEKFLNLQSRGARAGVVVNRDDSLFRMDMEDPKHSPRVEIFAVLITKSSGEELREALQEGFQVFLDIYIRPIWDAAGVFLMLIAFAGVWLGSWWATLRLRTEYQRQLWRTLSFAGVESLGPRPKEVSEEEEPREVVELSSRVAYGFICCASLALVLMFYFISLLIWVIIVLFAMGGASSLTTCVSAFLKSFVVSRRTAEQRVDLSRIPYIHLILGPADRRRQRPQSSQHVPLEEKAQAADLEADLDAGSAASQLPSPHQVSKVTLLVIPFTLGWAVWWLAVRQSANYAWFLQNVLGFALLLEIQRLIRIPTLRISTILLSLAFVYDVFWVFISPYIFQRSVMVEVATGGDSGQGMPMLLIFPRLNDELGGYSLLGLGDIALPGFLLTYLLRYDILKRLRTLSARPVRVPVGGGHLDLEDLDLDEVDKELVDPAALSRQLRSDEDYDGLASWVREEMDRGCCNGNFCARIGCWGCWRWGYFTTSLLGYLAGLVITNIALAASGSGQPALLYLVPCTLGLVLVLAWRKGDLAEMWNIPLPPDTPAREMNPHRSPQSDDYQQELSGGL